MSLLKTIAELLQVGQWSFALMPDASRIKMKVAANGQTHTIEVQVREESQFILGMLTYKRKCDPEHRLAVVDFINKQNFELSIGGLEMDSNTGLCRFRHSMDVEALKLTPLFVNNFVRIVATLGIKFWGPIETLMNGGSIDVACRMAESV
jgi:hypothetical protein